MVKPFLLGASALLAVCGTAATALADGNCGTGGTRSFCYDMGYGREDTTFVRWARERGCVRTAMGLGMLVEQAAESFYVWRGVRPQTAPVIAAIRAGK